MVELSAKNSAEPIVVPSEITPAAEMAIGDVAVSAPPFVVVAQVGHVKAPVPLLYETGELAENEVKPTSGPFVAPFAR